MKKRWQRVRGLDGSVTSIDDDTLVVVALSIDSKHIEYECPHCCKIHRHGSGGETHNRTESRSSHCQEVKQNVEILITSNTVRF